MKRFRRRKRRIDQLGSAVEVADRLCRQAGLEPGPVRVGAPMTSDHRTGHAGPVVGEPDLLVEFG